MNSYFIEMKKEIIVTFDPNLIHERQLYVNYPIRFPTTMGLYVTSLYSVF